MDAQDLCVDALLGIGLAAAPREGTRQERLNALLTALAQSPAPVLCVDVPSGLLSDTGQFAAGMAPRANGSSGFFSPRHTLSLLTLHPGLFTAAGRDAAGTVWFDDLGVDPAAEPPCAQLFAPSHPHHRAHDSHKGTYGDVAVVGGEGLHQRGMGMTGAALLAASAALHAGAGRVMLSLLDDGAMTHDALQPECMLRRFDTLRLADLTVVCGCGGGEAVRAVLPEVLAQAGRLVADADALNAIAASTPLQQALRARAAAEQPTVITPHPLEAARLLGTDTATVQADRLRAAQQLADRLQCAVVLKGAGSVVAAPGGVPHINRTGNARLATAGTGDVLAGLTGAVLARMPTGQYAQHSGASGAYPQAGTGAGCMHAAFDAALKACEQHGRLADTWPEGEPLTASALARALTYA